MVIASTRDPVVLRGQLTEWFRSTLPDGADPEVSEVSSPSGTGMSSETLLFDVTTTSGGERVCRRAGRCSRPALRCGAVVLWCPAVSVAGARDQRFFWISAHWRSTSSRPPHMKNACSATWSYSPSAIFVNASIVSTSGTVEPSMPVNCLAT